MKTNIIRLSAVVFLAAAIAFFFFGKGASGIGLGTAAPELKGGPWLNSEPLRMKDLRGKVVLISMWTFG